MHIYSYLSELREITQMFCSITLGEPDVLPVSVEICTLKPFLNLKVLKKPDLEMPVSSSKAQWHYTDFPPWKQFNSQIKPFVK